MPSGAEPFFLDERRIWVCVGAGGVGKTTVAAALGMALASRGKRVLCLTIDPARRLADSLGLSESPEQTRTIDPTLFAREGLSVSGSLAVTMLDAKRVFDEIVTRHAPTREARESILRNEFYEYVSAQLAGTHAYMAMEKLLSLRDDPSYDCIVLDTPPMAQAIDFLAAPERLLRTIDNPLVRAFARGLQRGRRFGVGLAARGVSLVSRALGGITGTAFLERASEFLLGMNDLFEGFRDRADRVSRVFRSAEIGYVLVTGPLAPALEQAAQFSDRLGHFGLRAQGLVINRVHPGAHFASAEGQVPDLGTTLREHGFIPTAELVSRVERAASDQRRLATREQETIRSLSEDATLRGLGALPRILVPAFAHDVQGLSALTRVARALLSAERERLPDLNWVAELSARPPG